MRTTREAAAGTGIPERLIRDVIVTLGDRESLVDVLHGGADAGFAGFTYYRDTVEFFRRHRREIVELVQRRAEDFGQTPIEMVRSLRCLRDFAPSEAEAAIARCLYGQPPPNREGKNRDLDDEYTLVANALAWYALEEVARAVADE